MNSFGGKFKVEVTHFVNPYKFFIKLEDSPHFFEKQLNNLITAEATKLMEQYSNGYSPKTNEYVIIYNAPAKTWNRAICEHVVRINKYIENEFILWNIDNGTPIVSKKNYILPFGQEKPEYHPVFEASVNNVTPGRPAINPITDKKSIVKCEEWNEISIQIAKNVLEGAMEILFIPEAKHGLRHFGKLKIKKFNGTEVDLAEELVARERALHSSNFISVALNSRSFNQDVWRKIDGSYDEPIRNQNMLQNTYDYHEPEHAEDRRRDSKIENWLLKIDEEKKSELIYLINFMETLKSLPEISVRNDTDEEDTLNRSFISILSLSECSSNRSIRDVQHVPLNSKDDNDSSVGHNKPKQPEKRMAYIPAGHERDLHSFHKYNFK